MNQAAYGLCCIDAFSKVADIELMKKRTQADTVAAMSAIFKRMEPPKMIYCDEGSEFDNKSFKELMKKHDIELLFTITHAPIVERFNRTIKQMIHKYLQSTNTKTITNVLPRMLKNYNNSYHSTIEMAPNEVTKNTQHIVQFNPFWAGGRQWRPRLKFQGRAHALEQATKIEWMLCDHTLV